MPIGLEKVFSNFVQAIEAWFVNLILSLNTTKIQSHYKRDKYLVLRGLFSLKN